MEELLYLTQTDTTIGFVSQNSSKIDRAKMRLPNKHYIRVVNSFRTLREFTRTPQKYKNMVRRSKQTTFIIGGSSFRVVKGTKHNLLLDRLKWAYSSSANRSGEEYNRKYAMDRVEAIVYEPKWVDSNPSRIYKLGIKSIKGIR